jgi:carbonic anhydrase
VSARADVPATAPPSAEEVLQQIVRHNGEFVATAGPGHFASFRDAAHPSATIVACSDSRFQGNAIHDNPEAELFTVRNIGNQVDQTAGSVAYGVRHLHTPLLLIIGHIRCSAVKAAMGNYAEESLPIRKELDGLHLSVARGPGSGSIDERWTPTIIANVHQQVENALQAFRPEVDAGKLTIVGAIYDFRNDLKQGAGRLVVVNVNGESNPVKLAAHPLLKVTHATILPP